MQVWYHDQSCLIINNLRKEYNMITGKNYIGNEMSAIGSVRFKTMDPKMNSENKEKHLPVLLPE